VTSGPAVSGPFCRPLPLTDSMSLRCNAAQLECRLAFRRQENHREPIMDLIFALLMSFAGIAFITRRTLTHETISPRGQAGELPAQPKQKAPDLDVLGSVSDQPPLHQA
jgi:hypothetical protein